MMDEKTVARGASHAPLLILAKIALWIGLVALSGLSTRLLILQARAEYAFENSTVPARLAVAADLDPTVADYAKSRGDFWLKNSIPPQPILAAYEYRKALELNPYEAFHWSDWGRACRHLGQTPEAERAFGIAESLDPNNYVIQREFGDFLLAQRQLDAAARHHARAIQLNPRLAPNLYAVYWSLGRSPVTVAEELLGKNPVLWRRYFRDCLTWAAPEEGERLWEVFQKLEDGPDAGCYSAYFDFLIDKKRYSEAQALWQRIAQVFYRRDWDPRKTLLWNGDLNLPPAFQGGLEWRIRDDPPPGARATISASKTGEPSSSLWIHFEGKENVAFSHVRHFFFVTPGQAYRLSYRVFTLDVTTDNGPYVRLTIYGDPPVQQRGNVVTGTGNWDLEQEFVAPGTAQWAEITICRDRSPKLDNKIKGDVWYDDFVLEVKTAPSSGTLSR
jgi:tetratricopeptide (TPR) repeat protein